MDWISGITPACAGNSNLVIYQCHKSGDHPRLRGEQYSMQFLGRSHLGSPPLARGTASEAKKEWKRIGITPACAGNSTMQGGISTQNGDHPRLRGEQMLDCGRLRRNIGSPPLARGTVRVCDKNAERAGITPACAGNRRHGLVPLSPCRDHPRLRGEQHVIPVYRCQRGGSPPLARGTVLHAVSW